MTDREMLEYAAKAAGIDFEYEEATGRYYYRKSPYDLAHNGQSLKVYWNSLTCLEDAMQLALVLGRRNYFGIEITKNFVQATCDEPWEHDVFEVYSGNSVGDTVVSLCRAITLAAAETGRLMK